MSRFSRGNQTWGLSGVFLTTGSRYIIWWYYCTTQCTIPVHFPSWQWLKDDFLAYLDEWEASIAAIPNLTNSERTLRCPSPATLLGHCMSGTYTCTCTCHSWIHTPICLSKAEEWTNMHSHSLILHLSLSLSLHPLSHLSLSLNIHMQWNHLLAWVCLLSHTWSLPYHEWETLPRSPWGFFWQTTNEGWLQRQPDCSVIPAWYCLSGVSRI